MSPSRACKISGAVFFDAIDGRNISSRWISLASCQYGGDCSSHTEASRALFSARLLINEFGDTKSAEYELVKEGSSCQFGGQRWVLVRPCRQTLAVWFGRGRK